MTAEGEWWEAHEGHGPGNTRRPVGPCKDCILCILIFIQWKPPKGFKQMNDILGHTGYGVESGLGHEGVKMWLTKAGKR